MYHYKNEEYGDSFSASIQKYADLLADIYEKVDGNYEYGWNLWA